MKLSNKSRYAIRALVYIANSNTKTPVSLKEISANENISITFLEQIFNKLRKHKIVEAIKGPGGGYKIATELSKISISNIFIAVDDAFKITNCSGCKYKDKKCATSYLWKNIMNNTINYLQSISLEDLIK